MYYNLYPDHKPVTRVQERTVPVLPYLTNTPSPPDSTYPKLNTGLSFPISSSSHALHLKTQDFHLSSCSSQRRRKVLDMSFDLNLITLLPPNPIHQVLLILLNSFFYQSTSFQLQGHYFSLGHHHSLPDYHKIQPTESSASPLIPFSPLLSIILYKTEVGLPSSKPLMACHHSKNQFKLLNQVVSSQAGLCISHYAPVAWVLPNQQLQDYSINSQGQEYKQPRAGITLSVLITNSTQSHHRITTNTQ